MSQSELRTTRRCLPSSYEYIKKFTEVHRINEAVASLPGREDFLFQVLFTHFAKFMRGSSSCGDTFHLHFKFSMAVLNITKVL